MSLSTSDTTTARGDASLLAARGVIQWFGAVKALRNVDVDINPGEILSLLGENGSGKSTLLSILAGVRQPTAGQVLVDGQREVFHSPASALRAGVTLVPQEADLAPHLTVAENIWMGNLPRGIVSRPELERSARRLLADLLDLELDVAQLARGLRPDEAMMVSLARACARRPRVLLLDETTASLGGDAVVRFLEAVRRLRDQHMAIAFVSHRLEEHRAVGDRAVILRDGEIVAERHWHETTEQELVRLMVGRDLPRFLSKVDVPRGDHALSARGLRLAPDLRPFDLSVHRGEILGLGGLAGSGRSRLARALAGAEAPAEGVLEVHGHAIRTGSVTAAARNGIGFLPEERKTMGLLMRMSVRANIALGAQRELTRWGFRQRRAERQLVEKLVADLRIKTASIDTAVANLSGGNQQKVIMARLLAANSRILILDEPTKGIDVGAKAEMFKLIGDAVKRDCAVVLISSELPELLGLSDRILVLRGGEAVAEIPRERATEEAVVSAAMGVTEQEVRYVE